MSALAEQHEAWAGARERLWRPARKDLRYLVRPLPPPEPEVTPHAAPKPEVVVIFAPFNFYKPPGPMALLKLVSLKHHVAIAELRGQSRRIGIAQARHEAVWLVRTHCHNMSTTQIGRLFGGRDHSTALNSIRVFEAKRGQAKC